MAAKVGPAKRSTNEAKSDPAVSYDDFKEHEGERYTGMKIGRSHKWYYDQGEWKEKKITPDLVADRLCREQATRRTRSRRIRRSGGHRVPLVHPGPSKHC